MTTLRGVQSFLRVSDLQSTSRDYNLWIGAKSNALQLINGFNGVIRIAGDLRESYDTFWSGLREHNPPLWTVL